jgi:hypothetical protein
MLGFLNFNLGIVLASFLIAFWAAYHRQLTAVRCGVFVILFALMVTMHPVPVALFCMFVAFQSLPYSLQYVRAKGFLSACRLTLRDVALPLACCVAAVVWILTVSAGRHSAIPIPEEPKSTARFTEALLMWSEPPVATRLVRYELIALLSLIVSLALVGWRERRYKMIPPAQFGVLATCIACFILYLAVPASIAGSTFFPIRFLVFTLALLAPFATASLPARSWVLTTVFAVSLLVNLTLVRQMQANFTPAVETMAGDLSSLPDLRDEKSGLVVAFEGAPCAPSTNYVPCYIAGARYFTLHRKILINALWTSLPISVLQTSDMKPWYGLDPVPMSKALLSRTPGSTLPADFVLVEGSVSNPLVQGGIQALEHNYHLVLVPSTAHWSSLLAKSKAGRADAYAIASAPAEDTKSATSK